MIRSQGSIAWKNVITRKAPKIKGFDDRVAVETYPVNFATREAQEKDILEAQPLS